MLLIVGSGYSHSTGVDSIIELLELADTYMKLADHPKGGSPYAMHMAMDQVRIVQCAVSVLAADIQDRIDEGTC